MALIVETGDQIANANSYVSLAEARSIAQSYGFSLSGNDVDDEGFLGQALLYIDGFRNRFKGQKASAEQSLQWPRVGATLDGYEFADDKIPVMLKQAQSVIAAKVAEGIELFPDATAEEVTGSVVERRVGWFARKYQQGSQAAESDNVTPLLSLVDLLLAPILRPPYEFDVARV